VKQRRTGWKAALAVAFGVGLLCGLAVFAFFEGFGHPQSDLPASDSRAADARSADPRAVGLSWPWLVFGFGAQAIFMSRMLVQWIATERARSSVVPKAFWWLSLFGGLMLLTYFLRRGDPVGVAGQLFGVVVYGRNLFFLRREAEGG
jgi:lipid-A-disaccharide synthase-like uncharacterized protein